MVPPVVFIPFPHGLRIAIRYIGLAKQRNDVDSITQHWIHKVFVRFFYESGKERVSSVTHSLFTCQQ